MSGDVPSRIDLRSRAHAEDWEATALAKRPWRSDFFAAFVAEIGDSRPGPLRVLELGSGPGFLAQLLLSRIPEMCYVALDFSAPMHDLARRRLGDLASRVTFVQRSFLDASWPDDLGVFDWVVTNQAVHELRHKGRAASLHAQVRALLLPGGGYLVCDHFVGPDGMDDDRLYMTVEEQVACLGSAGFDEVRLLLKKQGMVLHLAR